MQAELSLAVAHLDGPKAGVLEVIYLSTQCDPASLARLQVGRKFIVDGVRCLILGLKAGKMA